MPLRLKSRLPNWLEFQTALSITAFFVHSWSIRGFLHELPSFINYFNSREILSILAYMMATALLESALVTFGLVLVGFALPGKWYRQAFVTNSFLSLLVGAIAMIKLEDALLVDTRMLPPASFYSSWVIVVLTTCLLLWYLARKSNTIARAVTFLVERLSLLGYLYLFTGLIGIAVVLLRITIRTI